jgi:hypothetical protein
MINISFFCLLLKNVQRIKVGKWDLKSTNTLKNSRKTSEKIACHLGLFSDAIKIAEYQKSVFFSYNFEWTFAPS